jgi:hypothetical protein
MAEALGAVAAVVGVLSSIVTLYESCSKGYAKFTHVRELEKTYATLFMKLRIQEARFHIWGRGWGVQDGKLIEEVAVSEGLRMIVEDVLQQMDKLLQDSVQLSTKYGVHESWEISSGADPGGVHCPGQGLIPQSSQPSDTIAETDANEASSRPHSLTRNIRKKARWAISDKDKFELLVSELRYFNDSLYDVLPLLVRQYLQQDALPSEILRTDDRLELRAIFDAASGSYNMLAQAANIRNLNITDGYVSTSFFTGNLSSAMLKINKGEIELEGAENMATTAVTTKRALAFYTTTDTGPYAPSSRRRVLVEWRAFEKNVSEDFAHVLYSRVENLARLLHPATRKPSSYGALDCLGFYPDYTRSRYGFVYSLPRPETVPITLQQLLVKSSANPYSVRPHLGARFALARRIARSLLQLHASGWLHKGLCSQNILFFIPTDAESGSGSSSGGSGGVDYADEGALQAWITGFDYARPDDLREQTDKPAADPETDIYRHKLVLEGAVRYRRAFDIYSLGLILLEIGLWMPLRDIYKTKYTYETFKLRLEQFHYPSLAFAAGKTYGTVVRRCLDDGLNDKIQVSNFDESEISTQDTLCWDLVKDLEKCNV